MGIFQLGAGVGTGSGDVNFAFRDKLVTLLKHMVTSGSDLAANSGAFPDPFLFPVLSRKIRRLGIYRLDKYQKIGGQHNCRMPDVVSLVQTTSDVDRYRLF